TVDRGGRIDDEVNVRRGNVTVDRGGRIDDEVNVRRGNVTVDRGGRIDDEVNVGRGNVTVDRGGRIDDEVNVDRGDVLVDRGGRIDDEVRVDRGNVTVDRGGRIADEVRVDRGNVLVDRGGRIDDEVRVDRGNVTVDRGGRIDDEVRVDRGDVTVDRGGRIDDEVRVDRGNVLVDRGGRIDDEVNVDRGNVTVDRGGRIDDEVNVDRGNVTVDRGGRIDDEVRVDRGNVLVDRGGRIADEVRVDRGDVTVDRNGRIDDEVRVDRGNVTVDRGGRVDDEVNVRRGNVTVDRGGRVNDDVTVGRGNVLVDRGGRVDDEVNVGRGDVTVDRGGRINDDVTVTTGNVSLNRRGLITGDVDVVTGDVSLDQQSSIRGHVTITDGDVVVNDNSSILNGVMISNLGDLTLDNTSLIQGNVYLQEGAVSLDHASTIERLDLNDTVFVALGHVTANNGSLIDSNVTVITTDNLNGVAVKLDQASAIHGNVYAGTGDVVLDNQSSIEGNVLAVSGNIDVLYGSHITGESVESGQGNINLLDSVISAHVTINDGWLTVDQASDIFGRVDVNGQSAANVEGTITGDLHLNNGSATLRGGLLVGNPLINGNVFSQGLISPGNPLNPVGTVTVTGNYEQFANSGYVADLVSLTDHDRIIVGGIANVQGSLYVINHGIKAERGQTWNLITADSVNVVDPLNLHHNFAVNTMLTPEVVYTNGAVQLRIAQESFAGLQGLTYNQRQVAGALDGAARHSQLDSLFDYLNYTDKSNVPSLLSLLSPEELTAIFQIGVATSQIQNFNIEQRLEDIRAGSHGFSASGLALRNASGSVSLDGIAMADGKKGLTIAGWDGKSVVSREVVAPVQQPSRFGFFATGHGEWASLSGTSEAPGQNFTSAGVTVGFDYRISENFVVGINGGYTNTQSDLERDGSLDVNGGRGGLYASYFNSGAYVNVAAGGGYNSYDMKRSTLGGTAKGSTDGAEANALLGLGYDFQLGGFSVGPVASVQYTYIGLNEFNETGSAAPLHYKDQDQNSLRSTVGLKAAYGFNVGNVVIRPEARAQWKHEYLDSTPEISARFNGADAVFTVNGPKIGRDSLLLDAGASVEFNQAVSVFAYYTGELGRTNYQSHAVNGGFRISF
ncbi:MAG TPA: autotransporter domain-containing protein, partial [Chthoniobacteraceae bacterium]|nr:autotransporter domain-containing protein [Chthoniobacteraceae bacterium]